MNYKGKLSETYNDYVKEYCDKPTLYGYMSHEFRTERTDVLIEECVKNLPLKFNRKYSNSEIVSMWLCSRSARYFMDEYGDISFETDSSQFIHQLKLAWETDLPIIHFEHSTGMNYYLVMRNKFLKSCFQAYNSFKYILSNITESIFDSTM